MATPAMMAAYSAPMTYPTQGPTTAYDVLSSLLRVREHDYVGGDTIQLDDTEAARLLALDAVGEPGSWAELLAERAALAALATLGYDRAEYYAANRPRRGD